MAIKKRYLAHDDIQSKKIDVVVTDVLEIFAAHNIQPDVAMNTLALLSLIVAAQLSHSFEEWLEVYVECMRDNKPEFYDECRAGTTEYPLS